MMRRAVVTAVAACHLGAVAAFVQVGNTSPVLSHASRAPSQGPLGTRPAQLTCRFASAMTGLRRFSQPRRSSCPGCNAPRRLRPHCFWRSHADCTLCAAECRVARQAPSWWLPQRALADPTTASTSPIQTRPSRKRCVTTSGRPAPYACANACLRRERLLLQLDTEPGAVPIPPVT